MAGAVFLKLVVLVSARFAMKRAVLRSSSSASSEHTFLTEWSSVRRAFSSFGFFFFSSRRRHTRWPRDWSSDVCSSDLVAGRARTRHEQRLHRSSGPTPRDRPTPDLDPGGRAPPGSYAHPGGLALHRHRPHIRARGQVCALPPHRRRCLGSLPGGGVSAGRPPLRPGDRGEIGVRDLPDGKARARVKVRTHTGAYRDITATGKSQAAAKRALNAKLKQIVPAGNGGITPDTRLQDAWEEWLKFAALVGKPASSSRLTYNRSMSTTLGAIGDLRLRELTTHTLADHVDELAAKTPTKARQDMAAHHCSRGAPWRPGQGPDAGCPLAGAQEPRCARTQWGAGAQSGDTGALPRCGPR